MGSSVSTSQNNEDHSEDSWWSIENENFILDEPNLNGFNDYKSGALNQVIRTDASAIVNSSEKSINIVESDNSIDRLNIDERQIDKVVPVSIIIDCSSSENQVLVHKEKENKEYLLPSSSVKKEQTLEEFKEELRLKRMARQSAIADLRNEISDLKRQLAEEREINRKIRSEKSIVVDSDNNENDKVLEPCAVDQEHDHVIAIAGDGLSEVKENEKSLRIQLSELQLALQLANAENLSLSTELNVVRKQVISLKEVIVCSKQMIEVREQQVTQLKTKLREIEDSLAERELRLLSDNLRQEYDRQLSNIRNLRQLYEERARVSAAERENLLRQISIKKDELDAEMDKNKYLEERVALLETDLNSTNAKFNTIKEENDRSSYENKELKEEMAVINKLFSQMLIGFNGTNNLDIDCLTMMLEENRTLLNEMAVRESNSEGASLPKLLFDIVKQANTDETIESYSENNNYEKQSLEGNASATSITDDGEFISEQTCTNKNENSEISTSPGPSRNVPLISNSAKSNTVKVLSAEEIIGNLPKVWRVLIELLNHHKIEQVQFKENGQSEDCYKSIQTPAGPKIELSVSKTYIKLKDLILEKKALQKETTKLKTLNGHLERRLNEQEKRLSTVSLELTKTWHLVGKMQRQHRQLHTHEQILRYQLQQKRRLLNELKEELEYCRRKWAAARAKNDESQLQCDDMRKEFANRKIQDANNSAESGYSDGPGSDEDDATVSVRKVTRKTNILEVFDNPRKVERVQSESPKRSKTFEQVLRRENSAPSVANFITEVFQTTVNISPIDDFQSIALSSVVSDAEDASAMATIAQPPNKIAVASTSGTIPKQGVRLSRSKKRDKCNKTPPPKSETLEEMYMRLSGFNGSNTNISESVSLEEETTDEDRRAHRAVRMQRLEEQCKTLIAQVVETSNCREELNQQINFIQDHINTPNLDVSPNSNDENVASSEAVGITESLRDEDCFTEKEAQYTTKRSERLKRLEEESEALMLRIRKTTERGNGMTSRLEQLHSKCQNSRENSIEKTETGNTHTTGNVIDEAVCDEKTENINLDDAVLSTTEEDFTRRRSERIQRLEEESEQLMSKLTNTSNRGCEILTQLDELHSRHGSDDGQIKDITENDNFEITEAGQESFSYQTEVGANMNEGESNTQIIVGSSTEITQINYGNSQETIQINTESQISPAMENSHSENTLSIMENNNQTQTIDPTNRANVQATLVDEQPLNAVLSGEDQENLPLNDLENIALEINENATEVIRVEENLSNSHQSTENIDNSINDDDTASAN